MSHKYISWRIEIAVKRSYDASLFGTIPVGIF